MSAGLVALRHPEHLVAEHRARTLRDEHTVELAGMDEAGHGYARGLRELDHAIGVLKRARAELQALAHHRHEWDENDYCVHCGADGRA